MFPNELNAIVKEESTESRQVKVISPFLLCSSDIINVVMLNVMTTCTYEVHGHDGSHNREKMAAGQSDKF